MVHILRLTRPCVRFDRLLLLSTPSRFKSSVSSSTKSADEDRRAAFMQWHVAVLAAGTADTQPSVIIHFDSAKYCFGTGENMTRAYTNGPFRAAKTRAVFIPRANVGKTAGLASYIMFLSVASESQRVDMIGPPGLDYAMLTMRTYLQRNNMSVDSIEVSPPLSTETEPKPAFQDKNVTVYALRVDPQLAGSSMYIPRNAAKGTEALHLGHSGSEIHTKLAASASAEPTRPSPPKRAHSPSPPGSSKRPHLDEAVGVEPLSDPVFRASSSGGLSPPRLQPSQPLSIGPSFRMSTSRNGSLSPTLRNQTVIPFSERIKGQPQGESLKMKTESPSKRAPASLAERREAIRWYMFHTQKELRPTDLDYVHPTGGTKKSKLTLDAPTGQWRRPDRAADFHIQLPSLSKEPGFAADGALLQEDRSILSWVIVGPWQPGKFDRAKATALGIPNGPLRKELVEGKAVTFEVKDVASPGGVREVTVQPDEVVAPSEPPAVIMVLNCPSVEHIQPLIDQFTGNSFYTRFTREELDQRTVHSIFHICGPSVLADARYRAFMNSFPLSVEHVVSSPEHNANPAAFLHYSAAQLSLQNLDPDMFLLPKYSTANSFSTLTGLPLRVTPMQAHQVVSAKRLSPPQLYALAGNVDPFHPVALSGAPAPMSDTLQRLMKEAKTAVAKGIESRRSLPPQPGDDVEITSLGTASAVPGRFRNVSGTHIHVPGKGGILLDAGEGTWGQMARLFGTDPTQPGNAWDVLRDLKCIFVGHGHGDHQLGVPTILAQRAQMSPPPTEPLWIVSHRNVLLHLREAAEMENLLIHPTAPNGVRLINMDAISWDRPVGDFGNQHWLYEFGDGWSTAFSEAEYNAMCTSLGLSRLSSVYVKHGCRAYAAVIDHTDGWRIVYSGDTRPYHVLAQAGRDATLLIHEATYPLEGLNEEDTAAAEAMAKKKYHSTTTEAVSVAQQMRAKNTLLTHFTTRHPKVSSQVESMTGGPVALAWDGLRFRIGDTWKLPLYAPVIAEVRDNEGGEEEDASAGVDW